MHEFWEIEKCRKKENERGATEKNKIKRVLNQKKRTKIKKLLRKQDKGVQYYMFRGNWKVWKEKKFEVYAS